MSEASDRRNPLRLLVSKETQLRILWLVAGGIFFTLATFVLAKMWLGQWLWALAMASAIGGFTALWVSREIAGPFYRIEKDLEAILHGARSGESIKLRPGDPLQHLADLINELIQRTKT